MPPPPSAPSTPPSATPRRLPSSSGPPNRTPRRRRSRTPPLPTAAGVESEAMAGARNPRTQRYLVSVEYVGTRFSCSQQQPNQRTAVGVLEEAFHKFIGQPVLIFHSSRTDAGVRALSNVCHVDVEWISRKKPGEVLPPHEPGVIKRAVNHFLQVIKTVRRGKATHPLTPFKRYHYRLLSGPEPSSVFEKNSAWHITEDLNVQAMKKACNILVGHHDFSSFRAAGCQVLRWCLSSNCCLICRVHKEKHRTERHIISDNRGVLGLLYPEIPLPSWFLNHWMCEESKRTLVRKEPALIPSLEFWAKCGIFINYVLYNIRCELD